MIKETIKYRGFDGKEREEDFYFHLAKHEIVELNLGYGGEQGLEAFIKRLIEAKDNMQIFNLFKVLLLKAYGLRSEDGSEFYKDFEATRRFEHSPAFDELIFKLFDAEYADKFTRGLLPADMTAEATETVPAPADTDDDPAWYKEGRYPTAKELRGRPQSEIVLASQARQTKMFG